MQVQNQAQQSSEFEELTPLSMDEQDAIVGGIWPLLFLAAMRIAPVVARVGPSLAPAAPGVGVAIERLRNRE